MFLQLVYQKACRDQKQAGGVYTSIFWSVSLIFGGLHVCNIFGGLDNKKNSKFVDNK